MKQTKPTILDRSPQTSLQTCMLDFNVCPTQALSTSPACSYPGCPRMAKQTDHTGSPPCCTKCSRGTEPSQQLLVLALSESHPKVVQACLPARTEVTEESIVRVARASRKVPRVEALSLVREEAMKLSNTNLVKLH